MTKHQLSFLKLEIQFWALMLFAMQAPTVLLGGIAFIMAIVTGYYTFKAERAAYAEITLKESEANNE